MKTYFAKYWLSMLAALITYFTPLRETFLFVGSLVLLDWFSGMAKGIKLGTFSSAKCITKVWTSFGYFLAIIVTKNVNDFFHIDYLVKVLASMITIAELQSLRENIKVLAKIDVLKPIVNIFNRTNRENEKNS